MSSLRPRMLLDAWARVDARLGLIQARHIADPRIPLYRLDAGPPATDQELDLLRSVVDVELPFELVESLRRWNGRWIAHDHIIALSPIRDYVYLKAVDRCSEEDRASATFEEVRGPINLKMDNRRRICFASHEYSGSFLFLDFEDPPSAGSPGQVIRIGEEPIAEFIAPSFVDFLEMVALSPMHDDKPEYDRKQTAIPC